MNRTFRPTPVDKAALSFLMERHNFESPSQAFDAAFDYAVRNPPKAWTNIPEPVLNAQTPLVTSDVITVSVDDDNCIECCNSIKAAYGISKIRSSVALRKVLYHMVSGEANNASPATDTSVNALWTLKRVIALLENPQANSDKLDRITAILKED